MPAEWVSSTVQELQNAGYLLVEDGNHGEYRPRHEEFVNGGVAFIRAADMDKGRVLFESASGISESALARIRKGIGAPGDVLLSHKGTVGKIALAPLDCDPFVCSPQTTFWRVLDTTVIDSHYLYYYLLSDAFQRQLSARKGESDMADYVSLSVQRTLRIVLPSIEEQREIGAILGALDAKMESNRQTILTLEAIAAALFKAWFVDFEPIYAKTDGQIVSTSAATGPLAPGIAEDAVNAVVPSGWEVQPIDAVAEFLNGLAMPKYPPTGHNDLPVIKIAELRRGDTHGSDLASATFDSRYLVSDGDLLFSWSGTLEVRIWTGGRGGLNQHLFKVTSRQYPQWFVYYWLLQHLPSFRAIAAGKATTMGHIQRHHLTAASVIVPPAGILQVADGVIAPIVSRIVASSLESRTLATLRDTLLPKLLSGEIRVCEVESLVAAAI